MVMNPPGRVNDMRKLPAALAAVRDTWRNHASWFAGVSAFIAVVLGVVAVVQAIALNARGWTPVFGNLSEALGAIGTVGTLLVAFGVWRHDVRIRRADEREALEEKRLIAARERAARADQARLVVLNFLYDEEQELYSGGELAIMRGTVVNLSSRPIFDVSILVPVDNPHMSLVVEHQVVNEPNSGETRTIDAHSKHCAFYDYTGKRVDWDWIEAIEVEFVDASGGRWRRTSGGQPVEVLDTPSAT